MCGVCVCVCVCVVCMCARVRGGRIQGGKTTTQKSQAVCICLFPNTDILSQNKQFTPPCPINPYVDYCVLLIPVHVALVIHSKHAKKDVEVFD